jgi:hypothetical protein
MTSKILSFYEPIYLQASQGFTPSETLNDLHSFSIYPNYINIEYNYQGNVGDVEFAIIDNLGRMIYRTTLQNKQDIIMHSTENLSEGLYYCIIYNGNKRLFETKIIIQK